MQHLASDLLDKGLTPDQITNAVVKALRVAKLSDMEVHKHFMPVFSALDRQIIKDCKLSHLAYGLILMNADTEVSSVGGFQISVLEHYLVNMAQHAKG